MSDSVYLLPPYNLSYVVGIVELVPGARLILLHLPLGRLIAARAKVP